MTATEIAHNSDSTDFDDDLSTIDGPENLWRAVLMRAIEEAFGIGFIGDPVSTRVRLIYEARDYITLPARGFVDVCNLAGLDPASVRESLLPRILAAPSPDVLASIKRQRGKPGVVPDFCPFEGTGAGRTAQETSNISFSRNEA